MRKTAALLTLLACLGAAQADPPANKDKKEGGPDVNFLNSEESYWVNKGFNDTIYTDEGNHTTYQGENRNC